MRISSITESEEHNEYVNLILGVSFVSHTGLRVLTCTQAAHLNPAS